MKNLRIYQIGTNADKNDVSYLPFDVAVEKNGSIDPTIYKKVFTGDLSAANNLEDVFKELNTVGHPLLRGHSLSVSDVVVNDDGAFYCDSFGFRKIEFDEAYTIKDMNLHRVVYVEPGHEAFVTEIGADLESEQAAVCGWIELIYNDDGTIIVGNEEAKLIGMQGNRHLDHGGIIAGPFFVIGDDGENFRSLDDEEVDKYLRKYATPENISQEEVQADVGFTIMTW